MEIIVEDANIIIDLINTGLMDYCQSLDLEFHTTDLVNEEVKEPTQRQILDDVISKGLITIEQLDGEEALNLIVVAMEYQPISNLTPEDCSVIVLAERYGCRLLTNDQKLIRQAESRGIEANGILWLTDQMIERKVIAPIEMIDYLQTLLATNERAPRQLIMERIQEYTKTITNAN